MIQFKPLSSDEKELDRIISVSSFGLRLSKMLRLEVDGKRERLNMDQNIN